MNEAIGTDLNATTYGHSKYSAALNLPESTPRTVPSEKAKIKPRNTLFIEKRMVDKKLFSCQTVSSLCATWIGDARSISSPTAMDTICHNSSAASTAISLKPVDFFILNQLPVQ